MSPERGREANALGLPGTRATAPPIDWRAVYGTARGFNRRSAADIR